MVLDTARIPPVTAGLGFTLQDQNQFQVFQHQGSTSSYLRQCSIDTAGSGLPPNISRYVFDASISRQ